MPSSVPAPQPACVARDVRKLVGPRSLVSSAVGHQVSSRSPGATSRAPTPRERIARRTSLIVREIGPTRAGAEPKVDGEDSGDGSIEVSNPYSTKDEDGPSRASPVDEACGRNESDSQNHHLEQHEQPEPLERDDRDERQEHQRGHEPPSASSEPPPFQSELDRFLDGERGLTKVNTAFMRLCDEANTWDRRSTLLRGLTATSEAVLASFVAQDGLRLVLEGWLRAALESHETQFVPNMLKTLSLIPATLKALKSPCKLGQLVNSIVKNKEGAHDQGTVAEARMIIARWRKLAPASSAAKTGTSAGAVKAPPAPSRVAPSEGPDPNGTRSSAGQEKSAVKSERLSAASAAPTAPIARKAPVGAEPVEKAQKRLASKIAENPAATKRKAAASADGLEDVDLFAAQKRPLKRQEVPKLASSGRPVSTEPASKTTTRVRVVASNAAQPQSATVAQRSTQVARVSANPLDMLGINRGTDKPQTKDHVPPKKQRRVVLAPGPSSSTLPLSATASERAMAAAASVPDEPPRERRQAPSIRRKVVWADGWSSPNTPPKHPEKLVAERTFLRNDPPIMAREDAVYDEEAAQAAQAEMTEYVEFGEKAMGGKKREAQALLDFKAKEDQERREVEERLRALVPTVPWRVAPDIPQSILAGLAFQPGRGEASREVSERRYARGNLPPAPHGLDSPEEPTPGSNRPMRLLHLIPNIPLSVEEANAAPVGATQAAQAASAQPRRMQGLHGDRGVQGVQGVQGGPNGKLPMQMQMQNGVPAQTANGRRQWGAGANVVCKFHNTPRGCQYGDKCHFRHVDQASNPMVRPGQGGGGKGGARPMMRR